MAVSNASDLLAALEASNLLRPTQISALRQSHAAAEREVPAAEVARALVKRGLLTRWQAEKLLGGHTAFFLGKYRLLELVGRGGMGCVYKARHEVMGRVVALKVMARALVNDADAVARFKREVRTAAALSHPNIVAAYDADCAGDVHFLVMEYVEGRDLHWWIKQGGPLPVPWSCECIRQAAVGLEYARSRGLVHRDIKPSNLLVSQPDDQAPPIVKILDLGLARLAGEKQEPHDLTRSGQIMGTPDYIAPEQAEDVHSADTRADIFSLGCTLFQMLTGQLPYGGATLMAKLLARTQRDAPPVQSLRPDIPEGLAAVVARMLARRPEDRYQTPAEVAEALASFAREEQAQGSASSVLAAPEKRTKAGGTSDVAIACEEEAELNEFLHMLGRGDTHRKAQVTVQAHPDGPGSKPSSGSQRRPWVRLGLVVSAAVGLLLLLAISLWWTTGPRPRMADKTEKSSSASTTSPVDHSSGTSGNGRSDPASAAGATQLGQGGAAAGQNGKDQEPTPTSTPTPQQGGGSPSMAAVDSGRQDSSDQPDAAATTQPGADGEPPPAESSGSAAKAPEVAGSQTVDLAVGRTLIVGIGNDRYQTLIDAINDAQPGDTIRILHRGPLEFDALDLATKSPLTIEGGERDGVDYWPILVQRPTGGSAPSAPGLFRGSHVELTLRKLHLVVGGYQRPVIDCLVRLESGTLRIEHCTIQVLTESMFSLPEVHVLPLVLSTAGGPVAIHLDHVFARGQRLGGVLAVAGEGEAALSVHSQQVLWAGGGAPWISIEDASGPLSLELDRSTLYNLQGLLRYSGQPHASGKPAISMHATRNLFVGAYAARVPFIDWQPAASDMSLKDAVEQAQVVWRPEDNVYHRIAAYYEVQGKRGPAKLLDWQRLVPEAGGELEADPYFRVLPRGEELELCEPRDFQPRWQRNRGAASRLRNIGADSEALPPALAAIGRRPSPTPEDADAPRGRPRVLVVDRTRGPYKNLEAAFAAAQDDDVIEIADNGPYVPACNFQAQPNVGVLESAANVLTVRAREGTHPVIVLDTAAQRGSLPAPIGPHPGLVLFSSRKRLALCLDGLHLVLVGGNTDAALLQALDLGSPSERIQYGEKTNHFAILVDSGYLRCTNCTVSAAGTSPLDNGSLILGIEYTGIWLENCIMRSRTSDGWLVSLDAGSLIIRNCVLSKAKGAVYQGGNYSIKFQLHGNTVFGSIAHLANETRLTWEARDNLVVCPDRPLLISADALRNALYRGSNNGLWLTNQALAPNDREQGINALLPGPPMAQPPRFLGGTSNAWGYYRLNPKQAYSNLAADGGPVGVRTEYLPQMASWLGALGP